MNPLYSANLAHIVTRLSEELQVDVCSLYIAMDDNQLELAATHGLSQSAIGIHMSFSQGLTGKVARTRHSLSVKKPSEHPDYYHINASGEEKYQSYLGIPLLRNDLLMGVLVVQTVRPKMFFMSEISALYDAGRRMMDQLGSAQAGESSRANYQAAQVAAG